MNPQVIVIGTSKGGLNALETVLGGINKNFSIPIAVVQHRGKSRRDILTGIVQKHTKLKVKEASDKETLLAGCVYFAPADYHLLLERGSCALSIEAPIGYARPSIDVLFESAAASYGNGVIGVVLTGANNDGTYGSTCIKEAGGIIIVQDPKEAESPMMPNSVLLALTVDHIAKLARIPEILKSYSRKKVKHD